MVPSLSKEVKLASVTSYEFESEVGFGHIAYHLYTLHTLEFVIVADRAGKEQFVVFTSIKGACGDIHIEFLSHQSRLIVYGQGVFIIEVGRIPASRSFLIISPRASVCNWRWIRYSLPAKSGFQGSSLLSLPSCNCW